MLEKVDIEEALGVAMGHMSRYGCFSRLSFIYSPFICLDVFFEFV